LKKRETGNEKSPSFLYIPANLTFFKNKCYFLIPTDGIMNKADARGSLQSNPFQKLKQIQERSLKKEGNDSTKPKRL